MFLLLASTMCAGLFCGAALYVNLVEHPARMSCGQELAVREFAPSYRRATIMQVSLALVGLALGLVAAWRLRDAWIGTGAVLCLPTTRILGLVEILKAQGHPLCCSLVSMHISTQSFSMNDFSLTSA